MPDRTESARIGGWSLPSAKQRRKDKAAQRTAERLAKHEARLASLASDRAKRKAQLKIDRLNAKLRASGALPEGVRIAKDQPTGHVDLPEGVGSDTQQAPLSKEEQERAAMIEEFRDKLPADLTDAERALLTPDESPHTLAGLETDPEKVALLPAEEREFIIGEVEKAEALAGQEHVDLPDAISSDNPADPADVAEPEQTMAPEEQQIIEKDDSAPVSIPEPAKPEVKEKDKKEDGISPEERAKRRRRALAVLPLLAGLEKDIKEQQTEFAEEPDKDDPDLVVVDFLDNVREFTKLADRLERNLRTTMDIPNLDTAIRYLMDDMEKWTNAHSPTADLKSDWLGAVGRMRGHI